MPHSSEAAKHGPNRLKLYVQLSMKKFALMIGCNELAVFCLAQPPGLAQCGVWEEVLRGAVGVPWTPSRASFPRPSCPHCLKAMRFMQQRGLFPQGWSDPMVRNVEVTEPGRALAHHRCWVLVWWLCFGEVIAKPEVWSWGACWAVGGLWDRWGVGVRVHACV